MIWSANRYKKQARDGVEDNRIKILVAIIFLIGAAIFGRLFILQFLHYDLYAAKAMSQHGVKREILPQRGRIFVHSRDAELYPLAANKDFAQIYAVPKDIVDVDYAVEQLAPILFRLTYEEPDMKHLLVLSEQRLREEMANFIKNSGELKPGEEIVIDAEQLRIGLEKERLLIEEQLKKEYEEGMKEYANSLREKLSKKNDPYEPLAKKVDEEKLNEIMSLKLSGVDFMTSEYRYYPENNISSNILGYVIEDVNISLTQGSYGIEGFFNNELAGVMGSLVAERDASGQTIILSDRKVTPAVKGSDIILTIDKTIQNVACRVLNEATLRHGADQGVVIIMNPKTGAIIAMCSYPDFNPNDYGKTKDLNYFNNTAIFHAYEPGSIFKPITMAMGIDLGLVEPDTMFTDTGSVTIATETIKNADSKVYGAVSMNGVLENSVNTGAIYVARLMGVNNFVKYLNDFGFGALTGVELKTEVQGNISSLADPLHGADLNLAVASFGQGITATPLQMVHAFAAIANGGKLMQPYIVDEIIRPNGEKIKTEPKEIKQVIAQRTAALVSGMLVNVVENGHAKRAAVSGYYVAAKTGTAQIASENSRGYSERTSHSLVGFAPADDPRFVMITYFKNPKDARYAESTAAPLFGEIAEFVLNYYQVEKER
ncbi:MAG: penicillin-binding protein 2 [bacterium]|nr:penicillin-binding protein 2 [bacterium]